MLINQGCETGTYGESCLKKCYHCKNNATCGIQNGECDGSGCIGLYKPPLCKGKPMLCESGTKSHMRYYSLLSGIASARKQNKANFVF